MFYRIDGWVMTPLGAAVAGASVAVLQPEPADFSTQPGSPLADLFSADTSNAATIAAAVWDAGEIDFTFSTTPPADVVPNSFISVDAVTPASFDSTLEAPYLVLAVIGNVVTVASLLNPGTYVSGGTVATSVLPNPLTTDGNGHYFAYFAAGLFALQIYYGTVELDYPDQQNGTVAGGSVTSVALAMPTEFVVSGSPVTSAGGFTVTKATQNANLVYAGPASGGAAQPTFRAIVSADLPGGVGTVSSVAVSVTAPAIFTVGITGSPITNTGTIAITLGLATESANTVWAGPTSGSAAQPTFRGLGPADIGTRTSRVTFTPSTGQNTNEHADIPVTFSTAFADTNYTVSALLEVTAPAWQANHLYAAGDAIIDPNGDLQVIFSPGTSGATIPTFLQQTGANTTDNSVTWVNQATQQFVASIVNRTASGCTVVITLNSGAVTPMIVHVIAIHD
jgi:hypothetical protein